MASTNKVILTCAVTGAIHTPSMSPHLPANSQQIGDSAIEAARAGASILHLHARAAKDGRPVQDPDLFREFLPRVKSDCDAIVNITTGGSPHMTVEERLQPALQLSPEIASLNMGSFNFGLFPMAERFTELKHQWERDHLEKSRDLVFKNTFQDIERILELCRENETRFEFECYDIGHLYNLAFALDQGWVKPPLWVQSVFGILGGIGAHFEDVMMMKRTADRLFGDDYVWSVLGAGRHQMAIAAQSAAMGGNIRVGLEDSLWIAPGELAESNAQQVTKAKTLIESLSLEIATPDETREILQLKGAAKTKF